MSSLDCSHCVIQILQGQIMYVSVWSAWIQNVADLRRNGRIRKVFELAEPHFRRDMERDFRI